MISIALAAYNGEKYIKEQIDSILNQTCSDFELIICDDCSKDSTVNIVQDYCKKDNRIKLFINDENLGFKKNFAKAISLCSGEYIALSDQDDIWLPDHLEKLLKIIQGHKLACGNAELINEQGKSLNIKLNETEELYCFDDSDNLLYKILCSKNPFQGASMLFHRSFLEKAMPIPDSIRYHDTWFTLCSIFDDRIRYTFDVITLYRQHTSQHSPKHSRYNTIKRFIHTIKRTFTGRKYKTGRFKYIDEIKKRFTVSENQEKIIENSFWILKLKLGKLNFWEKIKAIKIYWKVYNNIYTVSDHKYRIMRIIKNAILGLTNE